ncbi:transmembrane protein 164-like [Antedon mediterranea]|uniref:transmembrane protein 164-like n=1 Tax=Antedon mediterranea TaxID=105859 RepID=UPI003AF536D3
MQVYVWKNMFDWAYAGVDPKFAGNGGPDCVNFLTPKQRTIETVAICLISILEMAIAWKHLKLPSHIPEERNYRLGKRLLLVLLCLTFGIEIGYKFATRTVIYLLNPCHVLSMVQIYLLAVPPSKTVLVVFRMQMTSLSCPLLAILLPVVNTRLLPFETEIYWLQHILIYVVIPPYLLSLRGAYTTESWGNLWWCLFTTGVLFLYHMIPLQLLGLVLEVNLNNMVCPAPTDPFYGPWYRLYALVHQHMLLPIHLLIYTAIVKFIVPCDSLTNTCNGEITKKQY